MNPAAFSLKHKTTTTVLTVVLFLGGLSSFLNMSRLEDPEFTIKDALVVTPYPGASAQEVEQEVTDEIETAIQQLGQLDEIESRSERGLSIVTVSIKDSYDAATLPQVWDELRRKVGDAQAQLPPGTQESMVIDDYGDVFGVYMVLYGEEYSYAELKEVADYLKRELLLVQDVARIELHGYRTEAIFIEPKREILSQIGISSEQIGQSLIQKNLAIDTGRVRMGKEFITIDPTGEINRIEDFEDLAISYSGRQFYLKDIADVHRGYVDPQDDIITYDGMPGIALGISTISGGNVVRMGEAIDQRLDEIRSELPLGMEIGIVSHQATSVVKAIDGFTASLIQALVIVVGVLLLFMGVRSGLLIGFILLLTIIGSFLFLQPMGVALERISLGALIIALGMLVDNAIVVIDGMLNGIKRGKTREQAAIDTVRQSALPLLGATLIAIFAFAAIGTTDNAAGEFCRSLFYVICTSLLLSWVTAVTVTPLLAVIVLKGPKVDMGSKDTPSPDLFNNRFYRVYKSILQGLIHFRWITVTVVGLLFFASLWGFGYVKQAFFPPSTRAQYMVDLWLPQGAHIEETQAHVNELESWLKEQDGIQHVTSVLGRGALRFILTYAPEMANPAYAQLLIDVDDAKHIPEFINSTEAFIHENLPDATGYGTKFELGPGEKGKIQARFLGSDPNELRRLASSAQEIFESHSNTKSVRTDWRQRVKLLRPQLAEDRASLLGIGKTELAYAIRQAFEGQSVGVYREGDLLLPIIIRATERERNDFGQLESIHIWSPVAQRRVPLSQVISGTEIVFEDEILMRLNRKPTITVYADPIEGTASALFEELRPQIEALELPSGYELVWYGEYKNSNDANEALAAGIPFFFLLMVLTTITLFNSLRQPLVIWMCVPLSIIGVTVGLLTTGQPFTFMALLGVISLSGMLIKNAIVMIDELNAQVGRGKALYQAIVDSAASRLLPVAMAASTTALGMIPLLFDDFFAAMAVTIVFGLLFATILTTLVLPVFYSILFRVKPTTA